MFNKVATLILSNLPYGNVPMCCNEMVCVEAQQKNGKWKQERPDLRKHFHWACLQCVTQGEKVVIKHRTVAGTAWPPELGSGGTEMWSWRSNSNTPAAAAGQIGSSYHAHTHMPTSMLHTAPPSGCVWFGQSVSALERETSTCHFCLQTTDVKSCVMDPL